MPQMTPQEQTINNSLDGLTTIADNIRSMLFGCADAIQGQRSAETCGNANGPGSIEDKIASLRSILQDCATEAQLIRAKLG
jgi:hypothetical protein